MKVGNALRGVPSEFGEAGVVARKKHRKRQRQPRAPIVPRFGVGASVRVKAGTKDPDFEDIPLGGWVGTITELDPSPPRAQYLIAWDQATLEGMHPIYCKRCERDDLDPSSMWLPEDDLEPHSGEPVVMEQPTNVVPRTLNLNDQDDRIRAVFGLTSDDPLPPATLANLRQYHDFLSLNLKFPFAAQFLVETGPFQETLYRVTVLGLLPADEIDPEDGILCQVRQNDQTIELPLSEVLVLGRFPNGLVIEDYSYWFGNWPADGEEEEQGGKPGPTAEEVAGEIAGGSWVGKALTLAVGGLCGSVYGIILGILLAAVEGAALWTAIGASLVGGLFVWISVKPSRRTERRLRTTLGLLLDLLGNAVLGVSAGALAGAVLGAMIAASLGAVIGGLAGLVLATLWSRKWSLLLMLLGGGIGSLVLLIWRDPGRALEGTLYGAGYGFVGGVLLTLAVIGMMQRLARQLGLAQKSAGH